VKVDSGTVTISGGGTYVISGELSNGRIVVNAPKADVRLVLSGASITSSDGPAIDIQDAGNAIVVLAKDSKNTLTDGASYASGQEATAALFSSDTLTVTGTGQLDVTGSYKDGISSKNGLIITGSTTIKVKAADDGLRGKDYLVVESGTLTVEAGGDALKSSEGDDETKGFISLGKASITLTSSDDAIAATTDVTVKDTTLTITAGGGQAPVPVQDHQARQGHVDVDVLDHAVSADRLQEALARLHKPMIAVALRNPYDLGCLPDNVCGLAAYEYSNAALSCITEMLKTNAKPEGHFSVAIPKIVLE